MRNGLQNLSGREINTLSIVGNRNLSDRYLTFNFADFFRQYMMYKLVEMGEDDLILVNYKICIVLLFRITQTQ
jgi:hypothetical protein